MTCPACNTPLCDPVVQSITICPNPLCLASVVLGDPVRRATADDTTVLSDDELAKLRKARKQAREAA